MALNILPDRVRTHDGDVYAGTVTALYGNLKIWEQDTHFNKIPWGYEFTSNNLTNDYFSTRTVFYFDLRDDQGSPLYLNESASITVPTTSYYVDAAFEDQESAFAQLSYSGWTNISAQIGNNSWLQSSLTTNLSVPGWYGLMFAPKNKSGNAFKVEVLNGDQPLANALVMIWSTSYVNYDLTSAFFKYAFTDGNGYVNLYQRTQEQKNKVTVLSGNMSMTLEFTFDNNSVPIKEGANLNFKQTFEANLYRNQMARSNLDPAQFYQASLSTVNSRQMGIEYHLFVDGTWASQVAANQTTGQLWMKQAQEQVISVAHYSSPFYSFRATAF